MQKHRAARLRAQSLARQIKKAQHIGRLAAEEIAARELGYKSAFDLNQQIRVEQNAMDQDRESLFHEVKSYLSMTLARLPWISIRSIIRREGSDHLIFGLSLWNNESHHLMTVEILEPDLNDNMNIYHPDPSSVPGDGGYLGLIPGYRTAYLGQVLWKWMLDIALFNIEVSFDEQFADAEEVPDPFWVYSNGSDVVKPYDLAYPNRLKFSRPEGLAALNLVGRPLHIVWDNGLYTEQFAFAKLTTGLYVTNLSRIIHHKLWSAYDIAECLSTIGFLQKIGNAGSACTWSEFKDRMRSQVRSAAHYHFEDETETVTFTSGTTGQYRLFTG